MCVLDLFGRLLPLRLRPEDKFWRSISVTNAARHSYKDKRIFKSLIRRLRRFWHQFVIYADRRPICKPKSTQRAELHARIIREIRNRRKLPIRSDLADRSLQLNCIKMPFTVSETHRELRRRAWGSRGGISGRRREDDTRSVARERSDDLSARARISDRGEDVLGGGEWQLLLSAIDAQWPTVYRARFIRLSQPLSIADAGRDLERLLLLYPADVREGASWIDFACTRSRSSFERIDSDKQRRRQR